MGEKKELQGNDRLATDFRIVINTIIILLYIYYTIYIICIILLLHY